MALEDKYVQQYNPPFRQGIVYALEAAPPYRVRVRFVDRDNIISYWLPVTMPKIMQDKFFWQPDIGEQVLCIMDEHDENGAVVGSIPSTVDQAPPGLGPDHFYIGFKDGTTLQYNRVTHQLQVALGAGGSVSLTGDSGSSITLDPAGDITFNSVGALQFKLGGAAAADSLAVVSKLLTAFNAHVHGAAGTPPTVPWTPVTIASGTVKVTN